MNKMTDLADLPFPHPRHFPSKDDIRHTKLIIGHLDRKIEDLESDISKLQAQLQQIQRTRVNYASYISPLRRLPTELLSVIIDIYLKQYGEITIIASVCSRLREVALGMAEVWSDIKLLELKSMRDPRYKLISGRHYGSSFEGGIQCSTLDQLALILARAGSASLKIFVSLPVEAGMVELIATQNCPIRSLIVLDKFNSMTSLSGFQNLNWDQLQELQLRRLRWDQSREIMDLALQSSCNSMTLDVNYGAPSLDLFKHALMKQVVNMGIATGGYIP
ncbi:hypothetical protein CPB86DRAFT_57893 [Serendipita vermifera]|nr:hypothetical protein CPB86DRAFT_57893 [Serendipita vermifera]